MSLKIRIALFSTFNALKNARPRIFLYTPSWSWVYAYSSLNSAMLSCSTEVTLIPSTGYYTLHYTVLMCILLLNPPTTPKFMPTCIACTHNGWKWNTNSETSLVELYLNFEKSSWKNQVRRTGFLACKNQFWNWFLQTTQAVKIKFEIE